MVAREGGFYGMAFQGARGVTQGDPLYPTIFNVVMDAVVQHWVTVMIAGAEERGERGQEGKHQAALFYADDDIVYLSYPAGSRVNLTPWSSVLIGWDCVPMSGRQSEWSAAPVRRRVISRRRRTVDG